MAPSICRGAETLNWQREMIGRFSWTYLLSVLAAVVENKKNLDLFTRESCQHSHRGEVMSAVGQQLARAPVKQ